MGITRLSNSLVWLFALFTLKPCGQNLLCNDTAIWIFSVRAIDCMASHVFLGSSIGRHRLEERGEREC